MRYCTLSSFTIWKELKLKSIENWKRLVLRLNAFVIAWIKQRKPSVALANCTIWVEYIGVIYGFIRYSFPWALLQPAHRILTLFTHQRLEILHRGGIADSVQVKGLCIKPVEQLAQYIRSDSMWDILYFIYFLSKIYSKELTSPAVEWFVTWPTTVLQFMWWRSLTIPFRTDSIPSLLSISLYSVFSVFQDSYTDSGTRWMTVLTILPQRIRSRFNAVVLSTAFLLLRKFISCGPLPHIEPPQQLAVQYYYELLDVFPTCDFHSKFNA